MEQFDQNSCWEKHYRPLIVLDHVRTEYEEIVNAYKISNGKYEIDDFWDQSENEKVLDKDVINITTV